MRLSVIHEDGITKYNLTTAYDNTLQAMAEIEGYEWLESQFGHQNCTPDHHCVKNASIRIEKARKQVDDHHLTPWMDATDSDRTIFVIYGSGGGNRWFVNGYGDVMLSGHHAGHDTMAKAKSLGFEVA